MVFNFKIKNNWSFLNVLLLLKTFVITSFIWIFFRAETFSKAKQVINAIWRNNHVMSLEDSLCTPLLFTGIFIVFDLFLYNSRFDRKLDIISAPFRWIIYAIIIFCLFALSGTQKFTFIYFQF